MKRILSATLAMLVAVTAFSAQRVFNINANVTKLDVSCGLKVEYIHGQEKSRVIVDGPYDEISEVIVKVEKSSLNISAKSQKWNKWFKKNRQLKHVKVTVYAPVVKAIEASSGARIKDKTQINAPKTGFTLSTSSAGKISLAGLRCKDLKSKASSGSDIEIDELSATDASFEASSGADIEVEAITAGNIKAKSSSGADIELKGSANRADLKASSGSSIKARGLKCPQINTKSSSGGSCSVERR